MTNRRNAAAIRLSLVFAAVLLPLAAYAQSAERVDAVTIASVDFGSKQISSNGCSVLREKVGYNSNYGSSWVFDYPGQSRVQVSKIVCPGVPGQTVTLRMRHLTSYSAQVRGNGYAPITIWVNGVSLVTGYDVAEHHEGSHGMETDVWDITRQLVTGNNTVEVTFDADARTNYWLQYMAVELSSSSHSGDEPGSSTPPQFQAPSKVLDGYVLTRIRIEKEWSEEAAHWVLTTAIKKAITEAAKAGIEAIAGELAGQIAGGFLGPFSAFIGQIPLANPPNRVNLQVTALSGPTDADELTVSSGVDVYVLATFYPGDEADPMYVEVNDADGNSVYQHRLEVEDFGDFWDMGSCVVIFKTEPITPLQPGKYVVSVRCGSGEDSIQLEVTGD